MSDTQSDPFELRLSEYVDGELAAEERAAFDAHIAGCKTCARLVDDLRRLAQAARALSDRAPEVDLWPAVRASIQSPRRPRLLPRWILAVAAALVLAMLAFRAGQHWILVPGRGPDPPAPVVGDRYLLLLHESVGFDSGSTPEEHAAVVQTYARWARGLGDRLVGGDELAQGGFDLRGAGAEQRVTERGVDRGPVASERGDEPRLEAPDRVEASERDDVVGGYFLLRAAAPEEALAIAKTCPHLERSGWIELRRIQD